MQLKPGQRIGTHRPYIISAIFPHSDTAHVYPMDTVTKAIRKGDCGNIMPLSWVKRQRAEWLKHNADYKQQRYKPKKSFAQRWKEAWKEARKDGPGYPAKMLGEVVSGWQIIAITSTGLVEVERISGPSRGQIQRLDRNAILFTGWTKGRRRTCQGV